MYRGFVPQSQYFTGDGTQHVGEVLAGSGYITLAPDFLGFGQSDKPSTAAFEDRFQSYTTALQLLSSLSTLNSGLLASYSAVTSDLARIGIWGHSNGGHITLSVLSITGKPYPTVLWNPVSMSFPFSVLAYDDESNDHGKALIKNMAEFESVYNAEDFSPPNFYNRITAPIQLNQGLADQEVWPKWSDQLYTTLKSMNDDVMYFTYPGADHNLSPATLGWNSAVARAVGFYNEKLK